MPDIIPLDLPAAYWRGRARQAQRVGSYFEAARLYRAALRKRDDNAIRRDLAQVYADMRCLTASDRLYMENLARDTEDTDSLYGLARNRSLAGDERGMADLLDLYLRLAPCGEQADRARDILWQQPREGAAPRRLRRAETLFHQALDVRDHPIESLRRARRSWQRGKTADTARLLCQLYLQLRQPARALPYAYDACAMAPQDMLTRQLLATALHAADMKHACRAALRQAAALCAGMDQLPLFCGCAICLGCSDLAAEMAEKWLADHPDSADLMGLLAMSLREAPGQEERALNLLRRAAAIDTDNPLLQLMLEQSDAVRGDPASLMLRQLRHVGESVTSGPPEELDQRMHRELVRTLRLPLPGMPEAAVRLLLRNGDAEGLRLALLEAELPPMLYGLILSFLEEKGEPLPCFARVDGRLTLLPQKPRPPYDADLHDLIHALLRMLPDSVPLDRVVSEVPSLWYSLPVSARRHCAQSADSVWPDAFAACLTLLCGDAEDARKQLRACARPRRTKRAFYQLIRRSKRPYEVHRF